MAGTSTSSPGPHFARSSALDLDEAALDEQDLLGHVDMAGAALAGLELDAEHGRAGVAVAQNIGKARSRRELVARIFSEHYMPRLQSGMRPGAAGWFADPPAHGDHEAPDNQQYRGH